MQIETGKTINMGVYSVTSAGSTIADNGATWNPNIHIGNNHCPTIQSAIDAASSGQTVLIGQGTYSESLSMRSNVNLARDTSNPVPYSRGRASSTSLSALGERG